MPLPDFAALHPGYEEKKKERKEAERRQTRSHEPHHRVRRAPAGALA
jgi:hypothetical protein